MIFPRPTSALPTTHTALPITPVTPGGSEIPVLGTVNNIGNLTPSGDAPVVIPTAPETSNGTGAAAMAQFGNAPLAAARVALGAVGDDIDVIPEREARILDRLRALYVEAGAKPLYPEDTPWFSLRPEWRGLDGETYLDLDFGGPQQLITPRGTFNVKNSCLTDADTNERFWERLKQEFEVRVVSRVLSLQELMDREHNDVRLRGEFSGPLVLIKER